MTEVGYPGASLWFTPPDSRRLWRPDPIGEHSENTADNSNRILLGASPHSQNRVFQLGGYRDDCKTFKTQGDYQVGNSPVRFSRIDGATVMAMREMWVT